MTYHVANISNLIFALNQDNDSLASTILTQAVRDKRAEGWTIVYGDTWLPSKRYCSMLGALLPESRQQSIYYVKDLVKIYHEFCPMPAGTQNVIIDICCNIETGWLSSGYDMKKDLKWKCFGREKSKFFAPIFYDGGPARK